MIVLTRHSVEWVVKSELQIAFDRLQQEKDLLAKEKAELAREKEEVYEDRRILTLESISIFKKAPIVHKSGITSGIHRIITCPPRG